MMFRVQTGMSSVLQARNFSNSPSGVSPTTPSISPANIGDGAEERPHLESENNNSSSSDDESEDFVTDVPGINIGGNLKTAGSSACVPRQVQAIIGFQSTSTLSV